MLPLYVRICFKLKKKTFLRKKKGKKSRDEIFVYVWFGTLVLENYTKFSILPYSYFKICFLFDLCIKY